MAFERSRGFENLIVQIKHEHSTWDAHKIRDKIKLLHSTIQLPAISTVHAVLDRHGLVSNGLVSNGRKRRYKAEGYAAEQCDSAQRFMVRRSQG
jgi:putative transposase